MAKAQAAALIYNANRSPPPRHRRIFEPHVTLARELADSLPRLFFSASLVPRPCAGDRGGIGAGQAHGQRKVKAVWKYLCGGQAIDLLLTAERNKAAALRFFDTAMKASGAPEKVTMDKRGANKDAIDAINARDETPILIRQVKYLNNIVEQDHRAIKRVTKPMLNFKSFPAARCVLAGIGLMHMFRKGQFKIKDGLAMSFADQFYALAGKIRPV